MHDLAGKVAIVCGAAGQAGQALVGVLLAAHASTVLVDRDVAGLRRAFGHLAQTGRHLLVESTDMTVPAEAAAAVDRAVGLFGRLDILVNLAGAFHLKSTVMDSPPELWQRLFEENLTPTLVACRAAVPAMLVNGRGSIVNVASRGALAAGPGLGPFAAAKAAVVRLTEALAAELAPAIRVNCVVPGTLDTPQARAGRPEVDPSTWVDPAALAEVVAFLASDRARGVTGAAVPVLGTQR
jgi:NAD(P)-dependent dehydrogenase (short-subunit alcohol dehydrogenase family)